GALAAVGHARVPSRQGQRVHRGGADPRHRRRARAPLAWRDGGSGAQALRERARVLDHPEARPLPGLLLRTPHGRGPERARQVPRPPVLRRLRGVLRGVRPELLRPRLRLTAARVLPPDRGGGLQPPPPRGGRAPRDALSAPSASAKDSTRTTRPSRTVKSDDRVSSTSSSCVRPTMCTTTATWSPASSNLSGSTRYLS